MKRFLAILLTIALLAGCVPRQEPEEPSAREAYDQAAQALLEQQSIGLDVTIEHTMTLETETLEQTTRLELRLHQGERTTARVTGEWDCAGRNLLTWQTYDGENAYLSLGSGAGITTDDYRAELDEEEFLSQFMSPVVLEEDLYRTVEAGAHGFTFSDPAGLESWLGACDPRDITASGSAGVDGDGNLVSYEYRAAYTDGGAKFDVTLQAQVTQGPDAPIEAPDGSADYRELDGLEDWQGLMALERMRTQLQRLNDMSVWGWRNYVSEPGGFDYRYYLDLTNVSSGGEPMARFLEQQLFWDSYTLEPLLDDCYDFRFADGVGTESVNYGPAETVRGAQSGYILKSVRDSAVFCLPVRNEVAGCSVRDLGDKLLLRLDFSDEASLERMKDRASEIHARPEELMTDEWSHRSLGCQSRVIVDKATGLPELALLSGQWGLTWEDLEYMMTESCLQAYDFGTERAAGILEAPALSGTVEPLMYRVTGSRGEEMYLLGTIHVGDSRARQLPEEIQQTLLSCDALAVEFDMLAYLERMLTGEVDVEAMMESMLEGYVYTDGSTAAQHLEDPGLLTRTQTMLELLMGEEGLLLGMGIQQFRTYVIGQMLESLYMELGGLSSDFGVDMWLMELAREAEMEILEVESAQIQMDMLTGFSDGLQELLLRQSLELGPMGYNEEAQALYELWLRGDEEELTRVIRQESQGDDPALTEEYDRKVSTERNEGMLARALEYLDSGKTVFCAVGLAHLLAGDGLVQTLTDAGYTVERVEFSE